MNSDWFISWLMHSERLLPVFWVLLLAASSAAAFPERPAGAKTRPERH
jgi:hypothetical protein